MADRIVSFVMSGGVGSRLWPLSREDNPKQFHDLSGDGSMLVKTLRRLCAQDRRRNAGLPDRCRAPCRPRALRSSRESTSRAAARSSSRSAATPPRPSRSRRCTTLDAYGDEPGAGGAVRSRDFDRRAVLADGRDGVPAAKAGSLVVFGITPDTARNRLRLYRGRQGRERRRSTSSRFVEKPDLATAQKPTSPRAISIWNTGIFLFRASAMRDAFLKLAARNLERLRSSLSSRTARSVRPLPAVAISTRRCRRSRSTMRSWNGPTASPWSRRLPLERSRLVAVAARCQRRPTRTATSSSATSSRSTARTPICAATAGCCRRSA